MLKVRSSRLLLASGVWLTIYVVCVLLVTSFIFFEVLDVDGSDFIPRPANMAARLAEPQHEGIKRLWLQQPFKLWTGTLAMLEIRQLEPNDFDARARAWRVEPVRDHRVALPRAALSDVPPSA